MNDYRTVMTASVVICVLAAMSRMVPALEWVVPALLGALSFAGWAIWAIRRELRIRRRLATPDLRTTTTQTAARGARA